MAPTLRPRIPDTLRPDPVAEIADFVARLADDAGRAARAAAEGRARDALLAAGSMQMLLRARGDALREALSAGRSARVPPDVRAAVQAATLAAASGPLAGTARSVCTLAAAARVAQAHRDAIGEALRARAPARSALRITV
ncbi:hypothetical protein [Azospirillum halopraeferens]|uniref:hypothetical protein n=1 Tax=Azospirillum halopraeferens TaxID=34010 RepID=UPI00041533D6|nr:hypothetical protein [Azospirillum halopraeferens]